MTPAVDIDERENSAWLARFMRYVEPDTNGGCWLWSAGRTKKSGYGQTSQSHRHMVAHRVSWRLHRGAIPEGLKVLHRCDVPACVNPDHLFLGTQADNVADMMAKGRNNLRKYGYRPRRNGKLTPTDVLNIRRMAGQKFQKEIAADFGVNKGTISKILTGIRWGHVKEAAQ